MTVQATVRRRKQRKLDKRHKPQHAPSAKKPVGGKPSKGAMS